MIRHFKTVAAAAALTTAAVPVLAQTEPEPPRTTYRIEYINFAPGGAEMWDEANEKYVAPSRKELGLPPMAVYWLMAGDWEIMTVTEMPGGMAMLDKHQANQMVDLNKKIVGRFKSEAEAEAMRDKIDGMIANRMVTYSHTHP